MRKLLLFLFFPLAGILAQPYDFLWTQQAGGVHSDEVWGVSADASGNVFMAGSFGGQLHIGSTDLQSSGEADMYIAKFSTDAEVLWAVRAGYGGYDQILALTAAADGDVYVAGYVTEQNPAGDVDSDVWFARLDGLTGATLWQERLMSASRDGALGIAVAADGSVFVAGEFAGRATFGGVQLNSHGRRDIFLAHYLPGTDSYGWVQQLGGGSDERAYSLILSSTGDLLLCGSFYDSLNAGGMQLHSQGENDALLASYRQDGQLNWAVSAGGSDADEAIAVCAGEQGSVYLGGYFADQAFFAGLPVQSAGNNDAFVARYDANGTLLWVQVAGGPQDDAILDLTCGSNGSCYVSGTFMGVATFLNVELTAGGGSDAFMVEYNQTGQPQNAIAFGGALDEAATRIALDPGGNLLLAGVFEANSTFGDTTLHSNGDFDVFLTRLSAQGITAAAPPVAIPQQSQLNGNYPNPFNPETSIAYTLASREQIRLQVFNILGQTVRTLVDEAQGPGEFTVRWDGRDERGYPLSSGVYLYRLNFGSQVETRRMVLLR